MAGKGGGAWKVAYADFVTAMMAFFMVMWLISQNEKVKEAVAKHFRNETGKYAIGDSLMMPKHDQYFKDRKASLLEADGSPQDEAEHKTRNPNVLALNNGERTIVGTAIYFTGTSPDLDDDAKHQLDAFIPTILGKPQKIEVRGHASRRLPGADSASPDAWQLSYIRCIATMKYLEEHGIPAERFRLSQSGPFEPCPVNEVPKRTGPNSRVEVFLLNEAVTDNFGTREEMLLRFKTL